MPSLKELQASCKKAGLDSKGRKAELSERLDNLEQLVSPSDDEDENDVLDEFMNGEEHSSDSDDEYVNMLVADDSEDSDMCR
jgi:hypothetical protein